MEITVKMNASEFEEWRMYTRDKKAIVEIEESKSEYLINMFSELMEALEVEDRERFGIAVRNIRGWLN